VIAHLDWPGAAQVCRIERTRMLAGKKSREVAYAITTLPRERAGPAELLDLNRRHWAIENRLHWRRDTAFGKDASRISSGNAPQALAALRNTVLRLVAPFDEPVRTVRHRFAENRTAAITLVRQGFL
jgi:predicted transposase YbfD/YdcC